MDGAVLWRLNIEMKLRKWWPEVAQEVKWGSEGSDWMSESSSYSFHPVAPLWLLVQHFGASAFSRTSVWGSWLYTSSFFFFFNHFTYLRLPNHVGSALSCLSSFPLMDKTKANERLALPVFTLSSLNFTCQSPAGYLYLALFWFLLFSRSVVSNSLQPPCTL